MSLKVLNICLKKQNKNITFGQACRRQTRSSIRASEEEKASQSNCLGLEMCSKCFPFSSSSCLLAIRGHVTKHGTKCFFMASPGVEENPGKARWGDQRAGYLPFLPKVASYDVTGAVKGILLSQEVIVTCVRGS